VAPNSRLDWSVPDVARRGGRDLALSLRDGDAWVRATARRLILERRPPEAAAALRSLALDPASPPVARVQSLRTLEALGELGDDEVLAALRSRDAALRETALQLSEPRLPGSPALQEAARALEADPDRRVRFQLALTLGEIDAIDLLARIAARDPSDRWTRTAVLLSGAHRPVALLEGLVGAGSEGMARAGVLELVRSLSDVVARRKDPKEIEGWLRAVVAGDPPSRWRREALGILPALRRAGIDPAPHAERAGVSDLLNGWLAAALRTSLDGKAEAARRVEALETLAPIAESAHAESLFGLLGFREPQEVRVAAARILALQPGESAGGRLLDEWPTSTPGVRAEILRAFLGRADRVRQLLERIEQGRIGARDLAPEQRDALQRHPDPALRDRARKLFARQVSGDREEVIREVSAKLAKVAGDRVRGEKVYVASCATCHRLRGVGTKVGPDLEAAAGRDRKALLLDLLDPNRAMDPSYQVYVARTAANEMVYGVISAETPASVTLRRAAGEETTLLRKDIAELKAWPASLMPEGLETSLTGQDFADLLEFLGPAR
jgi:putative heme-binding domain-containing protein